MADPTIKHGPSNEVPALGYDAVTNHAPVILKVINPVQDTTTGQWYGQLDVVATITSATDNQRVNAQANDFLTGSIVDLLTLLTLSGTPTDANTVNSLMGRLTKIRDLLAATLTVQGTGNFTVAQATGSNLHSVIDSGAVTETNSAAILAALDDGQEAMANSQSVCIASDQSTIPTLDTNSAAILTQVTNHTVTANAGTNLNTSLLALETGNLASLLAGIGAIGDSAWSLSGNGDAIAILKKIALLLNAGLSISSLPALAASTNTIGNVGLSGCGYSAVSTSSSATTVKNASGVFFGAIVTSVGASMVTIYDSSSGNILAEIPASSAIGFSANVPACGIKFGTSLVVSGSATNPALMVYYN